MSTLTEALDKVKNTLQLSFQDVPNRSYIDLECPLCHQQMEAHKDKDGVYYAKCNCCALN